MGERGGELALEKFDEPILLRSDLHQDNVIVARRDIALDRLQMISADGPQLMSWETVSDETCLLAAANPSVSGNSAMTGHPVTDQRK